MIERTLVFVDTSYLLASFYNSWEVGARAQLEIDLPEVVSTLRRMIQQQLHQPIHRQYWYDGIPDSGPHRYQRALRTCDGVQLRTGQLIEWGERRTQKGVDTRLVADLVVNAYRGQFSDFVLVSGDADMIPGVEEATSQGMRVHLYGFGWDSMSAALRHACDSTTILDPREDFSDCMQLQVLEGPLPPTIRERPINDATPLEEHEGPTPVPGYSGTPLQASEEEHSGEDGEDNAGKEEGKPAPERVTGTPTSAQRKQPPAEPECDEPSEAQVEANNEYNQPGNPPAAQAREDKFRQEQARRELVAGADETEESQEADEAKLGDVAVQEHPAPEPDTQAEGEEHAQRVSGGGDRLPSPKPGPKPGPRPTPKPSMMAPRRKLRSRYVPLPEEVWTSAGFQTPYDVGQQYATWWYENAASSEQRDKAHMLSGGGLPPEIDRPLLQFACETLHEYTLSETQRVNLRDGFHSGIRGVLINISRG